MGCCGKLAFLGIVVIAVFLGYSINSLFQIPPLPNLEDTWWGPGNPGKVDTAIRPFKINVPDKVLEDLKQRLSRPTTLAPSLEGIQQQYGIHDTLLKQVAEHWKTKYDWRAREQYLNKYPQFKTSIQGLQIHFIHVKPANVAPDVKVLPLLLLHGWPGSVREFYEIIPLLTTPRKGKDFVFEVIVPSLPGYGFSDAAVRPGLGAAQMAVVFKNLMERLGFQKYYIQGGDWGALIVTNMGTLYPDRILGVHSNMCSANTPASHLKMFIGNYFPSLVIEKEYENRLYPLSSFYSKLMRESGYFHIQATKPDTVGIALSDSPIGLLAYILEKFTSWTNMEWQNRQDGGLKLKYKYDDILDNIMIYWVTNSITTSMRLYSESFSLAQFALELDKIPVQVPTACAIFPHELAYEPPSVLAYKYKQLVHVRHMKDGGHFAAFEEPALLADDVWAAVEIFLRPPKKME